MYYSTTVAADRLEHYRAATLNRENELGRSIRDRGTTLAPVRPAVSPRRVIGVWFRRRGTAGRIGVSY